MDTILACMFSFFIGGWLLGIVTLDAMMRLAIYLVRIESREIEKREKGN